ncbi:hypothetical protein GO495_12635 [Chitinophaga oryziterrae]|uniref:Peptidase M4 n=1 Tax=Chitinophaga oryziterrae TaxID=1031224 RepID=A0A6N8J828_9BACT|nr:hypothetical protein [Chitinophaga oryziterrae]MVT41435.1 hypothetical protein [Chitinophaga oryziterrae]
MLKTPPFRKLRGYAFDPSLSLKIDTVAINEIVYKVAWEPLEAGPSGEYIEVIDYDPTTQKFYKPVDLNDNYILAQDGLEPGESNPNFHQQMVYAVIMTTINNFEKALGRKVLWSPRRSKEVFEEYVPKLRVYPHALREANAFYSPLKKSLLFGYFSSNPADETMHMPDSLVFTALSHDIIAHETTHAILDGMHSSYNDPSNPDVLAFHEAFADIVALFQHFTFPEVLKHQIARTKGDLASQNLLGQLAQEFGSAIGDYGSLRDAIGEIDPITKQWKPKVPDPSDYRTVMEPHARGSILVSAIFEAFINIYKNRVADLLRIASNGTGILPQGELHPDLVNRLADEAAKAAGHVLSMCIRALDYCPPVDITFGDYLRAIITADSDMVSDDSLNYRLAFIDAFRRRGIYPEGIKTLSTESLRFTDLHIDYAINEAGNEMEYDRKIVEEQPFDLDTRYLLGIINGFLREYSDTIKYVKNREKIFNITKDYIGGRKEGGAFKGILGLHERIKNKFVNSKAFSKETGLAFVSNFRELGVNPSKNNWPSFQIQNLRLVSRVGPGNSQINQVIFSIIQHSTLKMEADKPVFFEFKKGQKKDGYFELAGGCTLIFDLDEMKLKYAISKPLISFNESDPNGTFSINMSRLKRQYDFQHNVNGAVGNEFAANFCKGGTRIMEPFAFLHQH